MRTRIQTDEDTEAHVCDSSVPMMRREAETGESQEVPRPSSLVDRGEQEGNCLRQGERPQLTLSVILCPVLRKRLGVREAEPRQCAYLRVQPVACEHTRMLRALHFQEVAVTPSML